MNLFGYPVCQPAAVYFTIAVILLIVFFLLGRGGDVIGLLYAFLLICLFTFLLGFICQLSEPIAWILVIILILQRLM